MAKSKLRLTDTESAMVEAVVALLHPYAEVVLHDVRRDQIAAIWNPFSGRRVGQAALLEELPEHGVDDRVVGPYEKFGTDGHRITSVSVYVADGAGLICINLDRQPLDTAIEALSKFAAAVTARPQALFEHDWREEIALVVDDWCRRQQLNRDHLTRDQRVELINELDQKALFAMRGASPLVARALGISRSTLYTLLQEARS